MQQHHGRPLGFPAFAGMTRGWVSKLQAGSIRKRTNHGYAERKELAVEPIFMSVSSTLPNGIAQLF
jgi:hypothetical protein